MSQIEGYENYLIFEDGIVINTITGKKMKPHIDKGYYRIGLFKNRKQKTFIPNPENKPCVDHINRNRIDNRIENIRWATSSENNMNRSCTSNTGYQFISKLINKRHKQGFTYQFEIRRPGLRHTYSNNDLQPVIEYRNKFCNENEIEYNDK